METGEVINEKVYASPRPPPKISLKHEWKTELGSEVAQRPDGQVVGVDLVRLLGYCGYGMNTVLFEQVYYGGRVLRNAAAMTAEREALRLGIEYLTVLVPTEVSSFEFQV